MFAIFKTNILLDLTGLSKANSLTGSQPGIVQGLVSLSDLIYLLHVFCTIFSSLYTFCVLQSIGIEISCTSLLAFLKNAQETVYTLLCEQGTGITEQELDCTSDHR